MHRDLCIDIRMKVRGWEFRGAPQPATTLASRGCRGRNRSEARTAAGAPSVSAVS